MRPLLILQMQHPLHTLLEIVSGRIRREARYGLA
jgi:hypothetical protein